MPVLFLAMLALALPSRVPFAAIVEPCRTSGPPLRDEFWRMSIQVAFDVERKPPGVRPPEDIAERLVLGAFGAEHGARGIEARIEPAPVLVRAKVPCPVKLHEAIGLGACEHGKPAVHHVDAVHRTELEVAFGHERAHVPQQREDVPDQRQSPGGWDSGRSSHAVFLARPSRRGRLRLVASVARPRRRVPRTLPHGRTSQGPLNDLAPTTAPPASAWPSPFIVQGLGDAAKKLPDRPAPHDHQHEQSDEDEQQNEFLGERRPHGVSILPF